MQKVRGLESVLNHVWSLLRLCENYFQFQKIAKFMAIR